MENSAQIIITIGSILLAGLTMEFLAKKIRLPGVTLLLLLGVLVGPSVFNLIPASIIKNWFPILTKISLGMIAFIIGSKLTLDSLKKIGKPVFVISISIVLINLCCVLLGLTLFQVSFPIALILASLSTATAPTTTLDVVWESKVENSFSEMLLGIVAIQAAWCLVTFSLAMSVVDFTQGHDVGLTYVILKFSWEIVGAIFVGIILGIPAAFLTARIQPGKATMTEAVGIVLFTSGAALFLNVSFVLTLIVLGIMVGQFGKHHKQSFHAIEGIEWPFMLIFFILAGSSLEIKMLSVIGIIATIYIITHILSYVVSAWLGGVIVNADNTVKNWMGLALVPQGGLPIGLALIAVQTYPDYSHLILPAIIASSVVLNMIGPIFTRTALVHSEGH